MTEYADMTFGTDDLRMALFFGDTFTNCTFNGQAQCSNFVGATFVNCTFGENFAFVGCNCHGCEGIPVNCLGTGTVSSTRAAYELQVAKMTRRERFAP